MNKQTKAGDGKVIVGLGKTGLSCARYLAFLGEKFMVVDSRKNPPCLEQFLGEFPGVDYELGDFSNDTFLRASELIVSPGISLAIEPIVRAQAAGIPITGDIDIFSKAISAPIIAVTGSNGKSTVVSLLAAIFEQAGINFGLGGNLDGEKFKPALDLLREPGRDIYILELSSFQLETTQQLNAEVAVILNVSEDHMDRYADLDSYLSAKQRIFRGSKQIVVNLDSASSVPPFPEQAKLWEFSVTNSGVNGFHLLTEKDGEFLAFRGEKILPVAELKVVGRHNLSNVLAAMTLARAAKVSLEDTCNALREFKGLPHRCQWVAEVHGVSFYNDSKGTNVGATVAAIEGLGQKLSGKIVLIAGGEGKGADFSLLAPAVRRWVKEVILIGKDAESIAAILDLESKRRYASSMAEAVNLAFNGAIPGDAVLLSPACASFDMFNDFGHRGQVFISEVGRLQCQPEH